MSPADRLSETHVERLNEVLEVLGVAARAKPCKGTMALIEEGEELMAEGKKASDIAADIALIGAAHKIEHYEIAAYTAARNLAFQLHNREVVQLLH